MSSQRSWHGLELRGYRCSGCLLIFVLLALPLSATTYYVDNCVTVGSASNNGTGTSTPWQTIAKVNDSSFSPGDSVLFRAGCTWREQLTVPSSGSAGGPITFGAYGNGAAPIINGADLLSSGWTNTSGNVWQRALTTQPNQVFFNGVRGVLKSSTGTITTPGDWWWSANVVYVYSTSNPASAFTIPGVEASVRTNAVWLNQKNFIILSGLDGEKANSTDFNIQASHDVRITACTANYSYYEGIYIWTLGATPTTNNDQVDHCTVAYNNASGIYVLPTTYGSSVGVKILNNIVHDNAMMADQFGAFVAGIYAAIGQNLLIEGNDVYNNGVGSTAGGAVGYGIWNDTPGTGNIIRYNRTHGNRFSGIIVEDGHTHSATDLAVYGNVVYSNGGTGAFADGDCGIQVWRANDGMAIYNNTMYGNNVNLCVIGLNGVGGASNVLAKNNIATGAITANLMAYYGGDNDGTNGSGNVYTNNSFGAAASNFIQWGASTFYSTYATWEAASGNCGTTDCSHSIQTAPTFTNASSDNFTVTSGSSAIDAGTNLGSTYQMGLAPLCSWPLGVALDNQNSYGTHWEIGAFVFVQQIPPAPPTSLSSTVK